MSDKYGKGGKLSRSGWRCNKGSGFDLDIWTSVAEWKQKNTSPLPELSESAE